MLVTNAQPCDGHGRVFRKVDELANGRIRVEFENAAPVEMSQDEFLRWREAIRLAGKN